MEYTICCGGINGDCASKSKKIIQYIVEKKNIYIQGVPGGMCQNSGECSLC